MPAISGKAGAVYVGSTSMSSTDSAIKMLGFRSWTLSDSAETLDVTSFDSSGLREHVVGHKTWTGSAEKLWVTDGTTYNCDDWAGSSKFVRFFVQWSSTPGATAPAKYYYGHVKVITNMSANNDVAGVIPESITFQGTSNLHYVTVASTWTSTHR